MPLLRFLAALGVSLLIGLATGEIAVRTFDVMDRVNFHPRRLYERTEDPRLPYRLRPGQADLRVLGAAVRVNAHGLRGGEVSPEPLPGVRRLLLLGDSAVFGWGLEEEESLPAQLEAELRTRGVQAEVLNAGTPGYTTRSELAFLERFGLALAPDLVLLGVSLNDFSPTPQLDAHGFIDTDGREGGWLERHSEFSALLLWFLRSGRLRDALAPDDGARQQQLVRFLSAQAIRSRDAFYREPEDEAWERIRSSLRGMRDLTRSQSIGFAVLVLPEQDQLAADASQPLPQQRWMSLCAELDLRCLDLRDAFVASGRGDALHLDLQHLGAAGTQVAARATAAFLDP